MMDYPGKISKLLIVLSVTSVLLSLISMMVVFFILLTLPEEVEESVEEALSGMEEQVEEEDMEDDTVNEESQDGLVRFESEFLDFSFLYPEGYSIEEKYRSNDGYVFGEHVIIFVRDELGSFVFRALFTSSDFSVDYTEGCCYYFTQDLDLEASLEDLEPLVEDELQEVFAFERDQIDGKSGLTFFYATSYVDTRVVAAHLFEMPENDSYQNAFLFSDTLWLKDGSYDENIEEIRGIFDGVEDEFSELDQGDIKTYRDIVNSIEWN